MPTTKEPAGASHSRFAAARDASHYWADHDVLEKLARQILVTITEGDRTRVQEAITVLQASVAAHLADEERELLSSYQLHDPQDATRILQEHAEIRKVLAGLDLETDLHLLRADAVREFLVGLRAHATHEEEGMYRWAAAVVATQ